MLLSAVSVLVVAQSSSEIPEGLMNNPVLLSTALFDLKGHQDKYKHKTRPFRPNLLWNVINRFVVTGFILCLIAPKHKEDEPS